jgi:protein-tyrosine phosphatase
MHSIHLPDMKKVKILFVCLGNICRSPTAEAVVRAIAAREFPDVALELDSAGTADYHVGEPPDRRTVAAGRRHGYELAHLRARRVTADDFDDFDRILVMDRANLAQLERLRPGDGHASVGLFLEGVADVDVAEVPDPYHGGVEEFERVISLCETGARALLLALRTAALRGAKRGLE